MCSCYVLDSRCHLSTMSRWLRDMLQGLDNTTLGICPQLGEGGVRGGLPPAAACSDHTSLCITASPHAAVVAHNVISSGFGGFPHAAYSCQHHCIPNHQPLKLSTTAPILQPATHVLRCAWKWDVDANNSWACALSIYIMSLGNSKQQAHVHRQPRPNPTPAGSNSAR